MKTIGQPQLKLPHENQVSTDDDDNSAIPIGQQNFCGGTKIKHHTNMYDE